MCFALPILSVAEDAGVLGGSAARVLSHCGRQLIAQDSGCHSKVRCSSETLTRLLRARCPKRIARRVAGKEREELLLEARVQRELRTVPAVPATALGVLCLVIVEACIAFGHALVSLCPLFVGLVGALRPGTPCSPRPLARCTPASPGRADTPDPACCS
jgi:hypothetical protein